MHPLVHFPFLHPEVPGLSAESILAYRGEDIVLCNMISVIKVEMMVIITLSHIDDSQPSRRYLSNDTTLKYIVSRL